ncbi:MAG: SUMF1/EgtB/PvdO family nonheme iron enzyme, partial [Chloroflexi bacterium]|nr:SUMF1/EgtB/PvdO family nonheme iron enzyme [Chloroflexota bacterium]
LHNMQYNYITKKTEKQVLFCCQGRFIDLSDYSKIDAFILAGYLDQVTNLNSFDLQELSDLRAPFSAYADWMIHEYFWDKPILFYMYLDIVAAKGNEWPHWATGPHLVIGYGRQALQPVWDYLSAHSGNPITQSDILDAMNASTHQNHAGFFEFWESLGITLDPNEVADLANWDPENRRLEDMVPKPFLSIGTLRTEHLLAEVPQKATIHLDDPAPTNQIFIGFKYFAEGFYLDPYKAENVIQGDNVSVVDSWAEPYEKFNMTTVIYGITTDDPDNQDFPITLTYPNVNGISRFSVSVDAPKGDQLGDLYYLGPIQPITFELENKNNEVILPDTTLEGETFFASDGGETVQYKPGDKIQLSLASGPVDVQIFDKYGFIRGMNTVIPINLPPTANFDFNSSDTDTQMTMQFTDTSSDPEGQIKDWFWDFGDGQTSKEKDPQHTYNQSGSYSISLTVTDEASNKDTQVEIIQLEEKQLPTTQNSLPNKGLFLLIGGGVFLFCGLVIILVLTQKKKRETQQINEKSNLEKGKQFNTPVESEPIQGRQKQHPRLKTSLILGIGGGLIFLIGLTIGVSSGSKLNATPTGASTIITLVPTIKPNATQTAAFPIITEGPVIDTYEPTISKPALSDLAITLDGDPSDWPMVSPMATDLEDSGPYDFKSLYAFSDEKNLYLRIDPYGPFSTEVPVCFVFDIVGVGEKNSTWQASTDPNDLVNVYLRPVVNTVPQFEQGKKYQGFGLDKVFELVIPLEDLGNPKKIIIQAYANDGVNPFPQFDSFDPVTVSFDSGKGAINETATPNTSPNGTKDGMTLLLVPEGEFTMGSDVNTDEQPIHAVYLDSFWIDQTEVTNAMYAQCVTEGACSEPNDSSSSTQNDYYGNSTFNNYPVIYVDWFQAKTFCEWAGGNLPTEAQWEKAARGTDERIYPWGNESPSCDLANIPGCKGDTTAVGSYPAGNSPYGALDMAGNVWEWVSDWYGTYPTGTAPNPQGPSSGEARGIRGGSWVDDTSDFRSAGRGGMSTMYGTNFIGFRCALPLH